MPLTVSVRSAHARQRGQRDVRQPVKDDVLVDFVAEHVQIVLQGDFDNRVRLVGGEHAARGVVGRRHHDQLGAVGHVSPQHLGGDAEIIRRVERDGHGHGPVQLHHRHVGDPGWFEHQHLVSRIEHGGQPRVERPLRTGRHQQIVTRDGDAVLALHFVHDGVEQFGLAVGDGVVRIAAAHGLEGGGLNVSGRIEIRLATREVNDVAARGPELLGVRHHHRRGRGLNRLDKLGERLHKRRKIGD